VRFARDLGVTQPFLAKLAEYVVALYENHYTDLQGKHELIKEVLSTEEKKFAATLEKGLKELNKLPQLDGQAAFFLYESYGFPFELTAEIAAERGIIIEEKDFIAAKTAHQNASRSGSEAKFKGGLEDARERTVAFHTATHLLLATLRALISPEIVQKGSNITAERARFDFNFDRALTDEEVKKVEDRLNEIVEKDLIVTCETLPKDKALQEITVAVFAERYPDEVTVYSVGDVSKEICIGPHVNKTSEIGKLKIAKQKAVSTGVRRIYLEIEERV
jgi:alanyl-tRNA synthetase